MTKYLRPVSLILLAFIFGGWGNIGHKIINKKTIYSFPAEISWLRSWQADLETHAPDPDYRKSSDPTESPKHYIDIDNYPEFINSGRIDQSYDSIVAVYGSTFVLDQGILPWAIMTTFDSLTQTFIRKDWNKAVLFAADLGHYVADAHMPLHITKNYNGQLTNQTGVHSRYESTMVGNYLTQLSAYECDSAFVIDDVPSYIFDFLYNNYEYVDSVLWADQQAKTFAGSTSSDVYYQKLWENSGNFTIELFKNASFRLAGLIYTSWVRAGKPSDITESDYSNVQPTAFEIFPNYPNPFNPQTTISYRTSTSGVITLQIFDSRGQLISEPVHEFQSPGMHKYIVDGSAFSSGAYFYRLSEGQHLLIGKMMLIK